VTYDKNEGIFTLENLKCNLPNISIVDIPILIARPPLGEDQPIIIVQKGKQWIVIDPISEEVVTVLSKKPKLAPSPLNTYKDPRTGERRPYVFFSGEPRGFSCRGCHKWYVPLRGFVNIALESMKKRPEKEYFNSDLDLDFGPVDSRGHFIITTTPFETRNYCTRKCQRGAKNRRRRIARSQKYQNLSQEDKPDGYCKICGKDLSDKRAGALTCCSAHRQQYKRMKSLKNPPLPAPSSLLSLRDRPSVP